MSRVRREPAERARLVAAYRASGLSVQAFSGREGVRPNSLYKWLARQAEPTTPMRFAKVIAKPVISPPLSNIRYTSSGVTVDLGSTRLVLDRGFDRATLHCVLDVLQSRAPVSLS